MEIFLPLFILVLITIYLSTKKHKPSIDEKMEHSVNVLKKIGHVVFVVKTNIAKNKQYMNQDSGYYFIGYLYGIIEEICKSNDVELNDVYLALVYKESCVMIGSEDGGVFNVGKEFTNSALSQADGMQGIIDGRLDGEHVASPSNQPPYFVRLQIKFSDKENSSANRLS
jgi:hypothetical protein